MVDEWQAPGPGTWVRDQSHFDRSITPIVVEIMEDAAPRGMREGFDLVGAPLDTMDIRFVNGQMYRRLVPIIGASGRGPSKPPPAALMRLAFKLHPRLRRRTADAEASLRSKTWMDEAHRWETEWKPDLVATNRRLSGVDLESLDDNELADHLDEALDHVTRSTVLHFRLHISDLGPIAKLLSRAKDWALDNADVMSVLAGASPATSAPRDALRPLAREIRAAGAEPSTLDEVRAVSPRCAELLDDYLLVFGSRITAGYDICDLTLAEMPSVVLGSLRDERLLDDASVAERAMERGDAALAALRVDVPEAEWPEFDELVGEARRLYGLRDENGPLTFEWPAGVVRSGVLDAGRRLAQRGVLGDPHHAFDLTRRELVDSLRGRTGLNSTGIVERRARRLAFDDAASPAHLGPAPVAPDLDGLPTAMREMMGMTLEVVELLEAVPHHEVHSGTGIGAEVYRGTARVVADADEAMERAEPGDVIITKFTAPTFNSVLAMAGAVVTEHGGLLCHTAVIARELGIAAVVGVAGALDIPDGAEVEVDPVGGRVSVLTA